MIIGIDTSTSVLAIGLYEKEKGIIGEVAHGLIKKHGRFANEIIKDLFKTLGISPKELKGVAVGLGPGSFTGMRVGVTIGKVLGAIFDLPLWGLSSLANLAMNLYQEETCPTLSLFDARNERVYWGLYSQGEYGPESILTEGVDDLGQLSQKLEGLAKINVVGDLPEGYFEKLTLTSSSNLIKAPKLFDQIRGGAVAYHGFLQSLKNPAGIEARELVPRYMKGIDMPKAKKPSC